MAETEEEHELMGCEWEVEVRDANGNVTDHKKGKNSLLVAMAALVANPIGSVNIPINAQDTSNVSSTTDWGYNSTAYCGPSVLGPVNNSTYGIVVGRDNTPVVVTDYKINTQCTQGSGANQFVHSAVTVNDVVTAAPRSSVRIDRMFTNSSGNPITVKEIGLYGVTYWHGKYFCMCRDVIPDTVVANAASLYVKYTIYVTV